jgi:hypothetical protein
MAKKNDRKSLEEILKRRGGEQTPDVSPSETEIRSCGVCGKVEPMPANRKQHLWGLVIVWEYEVDQASVITYNKYLLAHEMVLFTGMPPGSKYLGTYMRCEGGPPIYRTMWGYDSLQTMFDVWANPPPAIVPITTHMREQWLLDPNRSEDRWVPASLMYTKEDSKLHNPFAMMTLRIAENLATRGRAAISGDDDEGARAGKGEGRARKR